MTIEKAICMRINTLCQEKDIVLSKLGGLCNIIEENKPDMTLEEIELICKEIEISIADFFDDNIFLTI